MNSAIHERYSGAVKFLYGLRLFGAKFGLENTFKLAALVGNPQRQLRFIHVAGTNGKGSTCAMLESVYRVAGLRVGLFTSPHLVSFRERIQVDREAIREADVVRLITEIKPLLQQFTTDHHPTFFEVVTVMALRYFAEQKCDVVIWETGLGGRLDATNIVTPLASVITNIGLDHQQWLGDTLEKIAAEKAGIIKSGIPVLTAATGPEALRVIEGVARAQNSPLTRVKLDPRSAGSPVRLLGEHQSLNAALASATVQALQDKIPVTEQQIQHGLERVEWPGRMQLVTRQSGQKILLDGAHNVAGANALVLALQQNFPLMKPALILGVLRDKDAAGICKVLAPLAQSILLVAIHSERTESPAKLEAACREANPGAQIQVCQTLETALSDSTNKPFLVIAGSLYLVGEALELLCPGGPAPNDEKALNEWTTSDRGVTQRKG
jgi:dihydrofolate synthase / folylpolyglutamate synthase